MSLQRARRLAPPPSRRKSAAPPPPLRGTGEEKVFSSHARSAGEVADGEAG